MNASTDHAPKRGPVVSDRPIQIRASQRQFHDALHDRIKRAAEAKRMSAAAYMRMVLQDHCDEQGLP